MSDDQVKAICITAVAIAACYFAHSVFPIFLLTLWLFL